MIMSVNKLIVVVLVFTAMYLLSMLIIPDSFQIESTKAEIDQLGKASSSNAIMFYRVNKSYDAMSEKEAWIKKIIESEGNLSPATFEEFKSRVDDYNSHVNNATAIYRSYVSTFQEYKENCARLNDADKKDFVGTLYNDLIIESKQACQEDIKAKNAEVIYYAKRLDDAVALLKQLQKIISRVQEKIDSLIEIQAT